MSIKQNIERAKVDYDEVYDKGKRAEYDALWDTFQENGTRANYRYAFSSTSWTKDTFKPKYDIVPTDAVYMFAYMNYYSTQEPFDFVELFDKLGITLDLSNATNCEGICNYNRLVTHLGVLDFRKDTASVYAPFNYASNLVTIDKWILNDNGSQYFNAAFNGCVALENIVVEGTIGGDGLDLHWSTKLSKASITSFIEHLSDTATGKTITFSKTAKEAAFTADEWSALIATKSNWTIALA